MQRRTLTPRPHWQTIVEQQGLTFHTPDPDPAALSNRDPALTSGDPARPYWDESAFYEFTAAEIDTLESAGNELQTMCLAAAQHVIDNRLYAQLEIPAEAAPLIEWAWNAEPPALYGRFDILFDGSHPPKLLEYNADTPTSLLEAAVIQWFWLKDLETANPAVFHNPDQFNSIHEKLIAKWKDITPYLQQPVVFASANYPEDLLTIAYLRDTAQQAGLSTRQLLMEQIGWNQPRQAFVDIDPAESSIHTLFKLYPWESMLDEAFAAQCLSTYKQMVWIEPIWKLLLSNKGILPILWQLYPNHPLLLEAHFVNSTNLGAPGPASGTWDSTTSPASGTWNRTTSPAAGNRNWNPAPGWVRKPMHSREGANIVMATPSGQVITTPGPYDNRLLIDQAFGPVASFTDASTGTQRFPVLGLWMVDQECCGLGIRESSGPITGNLSSFVPHIFR